MSVIQYDVKKYNWLVIGSNSFSESVHLLDSYGIRAVSPRQNLGSLTGKYRIIRFTRPLSSSSVVKGTGFSVCDVFTGHGIGKEFHAPPQILHTGKYL